MKTILTIIALFVSGILYAQNDITEQYRVIKVQGDILRLKTGSMLLSGDQFESNEALNFITDFSRVAIISPLKGRFILTKGKGENNTSNVNFLPAMNNLSLRATFNSPGDIIDYFNGDILFLDIDSLKFNPSKIQIDETTYFSISYDNGNGITNNKIIASNGALNLINDSIFKSSAPNKAMIEYISTSGRLLSNEFSPIFPDELVLIKEVNLIISNSNNKSRDSVVNDVTSYLNDFYGKVSLVSVNAWMIKNMKY